MTKITIHWQKMQYHKKVAISVSLTSWTWGTATFFPETGTSYTLSSLPIGSKIAKAASSLYVITNSSGTTLWSISLSESPWYEISDCDIVRWWVHVAISNTTLEDWDTIEAVFKASTKPIQFYLWWKYQWYWDPWNYATIYYNWQPLNPNVSYIEIQNNRDHVDLDINFGWLEGNFKFYEGGTPSSADLLRAEIIDTTYKISQIEYYDADGGSTYICDWTSTVIWNVWDMWMARILLDIGQTCDLVSYKDAWWTSPDDKRNPIRDALQHFVGQFWQFQDFQVAAPNNLSYEYILYDWGKYCWLAYWDLRYVYYDPQTWQGYNINTSVIVAFFYDGYDLYVTPYERHPSWPYQFLPQWSNTSLYDPTGYISQAFTYWDKNVLLHWMQDWNCWDACDLIYTIYNLATNK